MQGGGGDFPEIGDEQQESIRSAGRVRSRGRMMRRKPVRRLAPDTQAASSSTLSSCTTCAPIGLGRVREKAGDVAEIPGPISVPYIGR